MQEGQRNTLTTQVYKTAETVMHEWLPVLGSVASHSTSKVTKNQPSTALPVEVCGSDAAQWDHHQYHTLQQKLPMEIFRTAAMKGLNDEYKLFYSS